MKQRTKYVFERMALRCIAVLVICCFSNGSAMAAPKCDLPEDIVEWMHDQSVAEIVKAWPSHLKTGVLWEAFQAVLQDKATTDQETLVKACIDE